MVWAGSPPVFSRSSLQLEQWARNARRRSISIRDGTRTTAGLQRPPEGRSGRTLVLVARRPIAPRRARLAVFFTPPHKPLLTRKESLLTRWPVTPPPPPNSWASGAEA